MDGFAVLATTEEDGETFISVETSPRAVEVTELAVAVTIGVELALFEPQKLK